VRGKSKAKSFKKIDERIDTAQQAVKNYTNPDWVSDKIDKCKNNQTSPAGRNKSDPV
jgi:hypothetical protein